MLRLMVIAAVALVAASLPARADSGVEVTLSSRLQTLEARIDAIEQGREKLFRKNQHYDRSPTVSTRKFASSRYQNVAWANELLVPDLADYGLRNLVSALVAESLERAGIDRSGMLVRVQLDALRVVNHPLTRLNGATSYARGSISLVDAASGKVVRSVEITANPVIDPTADLGYQGPDFAFEDTDRTLRVGPTLAYFVMKGLEALYEGTEFPHPVAIDYTQLSG